MTTSVHHASRPSPMQRVARAFRLVQSRGMLIDGPGQRRLSLIDESRARVPVAEPALLARFVDRLRALLATDDEATRRQLEREVLALAMPLQAAGVFELLRIAHVPLATMVDDHLRSAACA